MPDQTVAETLIYYGGLALIHGTALALVTWLLSAIILRRSRPALQAALWTLVLIKFLLPPVLPGEIAMSGWIAQAVASATAAESLSPESPSLELTRNDTADSMEYTSARATLNIFASLILAAYLLVVILLSSRALQSILRTRRRSRALRPADQRCRDEVIRLSASINLRRPPEVKATDEEMTPYVFGLRRAVLVLPDRLMQTLTKTERRALILHELAHVRRKDQLIRWLQTVARILFFFFPPVLWVCRRIEHFAEMACDRWAISISGVEPYAYAGALVSVVKDRSQQSRAHAGLPLVRGTQFLEERLRAVLREDAKGSPGLSAGAKAALTGWSLFALAGGSAAESPKKKPDLPRVEARKVQEVSPPAGADKKDGSTMTPSGERSAQSPGRVRTQTKQTGRPGQRQATEIDPPVIKDRPLTPYEEGFLLGKRYSEERAKWSRANAAATEASERTTRPRDVQSKREIELRMQRLITQPPRQ